MAEEPVISLDECERMPLRERVYQKIKQAILRGELRPGERVVEGDLASKLRTSRTPVREALRRLEYEGFLEVDPWKRVTVRDLTVKAVVEAYECREALEGMAARLAAVRADEDGLSELEAILTAPQAGPDDLERVNERFHALLVRLSGNERLRQLLEVFRDQISRDRHVTAHHSARSQEILSEHRAILAALRARDGDRAEQLTREHIRRAKDFAIRFMGKQ